MKKVSEYRVFNIDGEYIAGTFARSMTEAEKNVEKWGLTKNRYIIKRPGLKYLDGHIIYSTDIQTG